jgi:hypothetical protein
MLECARTWITDQRAPPPSWLKTMMAAVSKSRTRSAHEKTAAHSPSICASVIADGRTEVMTVALKDVAGRTLRLSDIRPAAIRRPRLATPHRG